jgi:uridylate kinase
MEVDSNSNIKYHRVLLKLSGESLNGEQQPSCFSMKAVSLLTESIQEICKKKIQLAIVIGGGNIWRGRDAITNGIPQVAADMIGMTATMLNALVFQAMLDQRGISSKILSPNPFEPLIEKHHWKKAVDYLDCGQIVLFAGGTGCPLFSTDTASALRAVEINADLILKATTVPYVYDDDPRKNHHAVRLETVTYDEIIQKKLQVIDETAAVICRTYAIPMQIFSVHEPSNLIKVLEGDKSIGTCVLVKPKQND